MSPAARGAWLLAAWLAGAPAAAAAEVTSLAFSRDGDVYRLVASLDIAAPADGVYDVLVDYAGFGRLSSVFEASRVLDPIGADGEGEVYLLMKGCVLFFCKTVEMVERILVEPGERIGIEVVPGRSDLEYGHGEWRLAATGEGTGVEYFMEMRPKFWIPPGIGPWVIRQALRRRVPRAAQRLEYLARGEPIPAELAVSR